MTDEVDVEMVLATYIDTNITGMDLPSTGGAKNLFAGDMPPLPDYAISVIRYEGRQPDETFSNPLHTRHPRVQVMIRDSDSKKALDQAGAVMRLFVAVKDQVIGGTTFQRIKNVGEPFEIGPDSHVRQRATVNFEVSYYDSL